MRYYTGIGSRRTPPAVLATMQRAAARLAELGWVLRSGGCEGADEAFERGHHPAAKQIFLPWPGFNRQLRRDLGDVNTIPRPAQRAYEVAEAYHPAWGRLSNGGKALQARNVHQVLGEDLALPSPSELVLCWTPDGAEEAEQTSPATGGTGQAIRLATAFGVPVFNLYHADALHRAARIIKAERDGP